MWSLEDAECGKCGKCEVYKMCRKFQFPWTFHVKRGVCNSEVLGKNASIRSKLPTAACRSWKKREEGVKPACFMSKATSVPQANHAQ